MLSSGCLSQSNGLKYGSTEEGKLTLTFELQQSDTYLQSDWGNAMLTIELTNRAGPDHSLLLKARDDEGRIEMNRVHELSQQQSANQSSGLGAAIMRQCAKLLNATIYLQIRAETTTFVLRVPVHQCDAPSPSPTHCNTTSIPQGSNLNVGCPAELSLRPPLRPTRAIVVDDQMSCRLVLKSRLSNHLGFTQVEMLGETAASIRQAAQTIAGATIPAQVVIVDNCLNKEGLTEAEMDGGRLLKDLTGDMRVSAMLVLSSADTFADTAKEYHCFISKSTDNFSEQFSIAWDEFIRTRPLHGQRVCIVDDSPSTVQIMATQLHSAGVSVWQVESGDKFLELGAELNFPWDVILLDYSMPGLNGIQTLKRINKDVKARLRIIGFSTEDDKEDAFLTAGACAYVRKRLSAFNEVAELMLNYDLNKAQQCEAKESADVCGSQPDLESAEVDQIGLIMELLSFTEPDAIRILETVKGEILNRIETCAKLLERDLLEQPQIEGLQREFHTIKGSANMAILKDAARAAEATETTLRQLLEQGCDQLPSTVRDQAIRSLHQIRSELH